MPVSRANVNGNRQDNVKENRTVFVPYQTRVFVHILNRAKTASIPLPGLVVSLPQLTTFVRKATATRPEQAVSAQVIDVITLRDRIGADGKPTGERYLRRSTEQLAFLSKRFDVIQGLDGMTEQALEEALSDDIAAYQVARAAQVTLADEDLEPMAATA